MGIILSILSFAASPIGRCVVAGLGGLTLLGSVYMKGRWDQRASDKAKLQQEISDAVAKGKQGSADALREFDAGKLPNTWFRD